MSLSYTVITTSQYNASGAAVLTSADEDLQIISGISVVGNNGGSGVQLTATSPTTTAGGEVDAAGYVGGGTGIYYAYDKGDETISVAPTGSVVGGGDGVYLVVSNTGVGGSQIVRNAGYISGGINGVYASNNPIESAQIENSGTIEGATGLVLGSGTNDNIINDASGLITGGVAIEVNGDDALVDNAGKVSGTSATQAAVVFVGSASDVETSGTIEGINTAIDFTGASGFDSVYNSGTISANRYSINFEEGSNNYLENSGTISGEVNFGLSSDWIINQLGGVMEVQPNFNADIIDSAGGELHVVNRGEMTGDIYDGGGDSSFVNTGDYAGELQIYGGDALVRNLGKITFDGSTMVEADVKADTTELSGQNIYIEGASGDDDLMVNATGAVIDATGAIAIEHDALGTFRLINRGDIYGDIDLYGQSSVVNRGEIGGDVNFEAAASLFVNSGAIDGDVTFSGTGNIYRGQLGQVTGTIYGAGSDGRYFGGSADETFNMTNGGAQLVNGGDGDDTFIFNPTGLTPSTLVRGGGGDDTLTFATAGTISAGAFANVQSIETINLAAGTNNLTIPDSLATSANGGSLMINGNSGADNINVSGVTNANDTVTIDGGANADTITAGGGKDVFFYSKVTDSTGLGLDTLNKVNFGVDRFAISTFASPILAINAAVTTGSLSSSSFNADLTNALNGKLGAHDAVLFTPNGGTLSGQTYLVVDVNGTAGYQGGGDLVFHLTGQTGTLATTDFI